jgi:hypothetical protein
MYGDITRDTFDQRKHYARVLYQQGRVGLDADPNEQTAILLHYLRSLARDLVGSAWGPKGDLGFAITAGTGGDFKIGAGHYYVDGILCECETPCTYRTQPHYPLAADEQDPAGFPCLFYLDVWERHVTYISDDRIREAALNGPDTASRTQVVWQVRTWPVAGASCAAMDPAWDKLEPKLKQTSLRGELTASIADADPSTDPCTISPKSAYRGPENQLYRVEIHRPGKAVDGGATFMYSRDNGSVCFPIISLAGGEAEVASLGRDDRHRLRIGDWVQVLYDEVVLRGRQPAPLAQVIQLDEGAGRVTLAAKPDDTELPVYPVRNENAARGDRVTHPFLRRWDQRERQRGARTPLPAWVADDGALALVEDRWLPLEDGVQIMFSKPAGAEAHEYRSGDYWLIPARVATGKLEWPSDEHGDPVPQAPHGVEHHFAPLAVTAAAGAAPDSCRTPF